MEATMNAMQVATTGIATQDKKAVSIQDADCRVKFTTPGQSFNYKVCSLTKSTLSRHNSNNKNWLNKSVLLFPIVLAFLSLSLPAVQAERCANRPALLTIRHENCIPKVVLVPSCLGRCRSYTMTDIEDPSNLQASCTCCMELDYIFSSATIRCPRPKGEIGYMNVTIPVKLPTKCSCRPCAPLPKIIPSELL